MESKCIIPECFTRDSKIRQKVAHLHDTLAITSLCIHLPDTRACLLNYLQAARLRSAQWAAFPWLSRFIKKYIHAGIGEVRAIKPALDKSLIHLTPWKSKVHFHDQNNLESNGQ